MLFLPDITEIVCRPIAMGVCDWTPIKQPHNLELWIIGWLHLTFHVNRRTFANGRQLLGQWDDESGSDNLRLNNYRLRCLSILQFLNLDPTLFMLGVEE